MTRRNTIQKELVLNAVRSMKNHVTAEDVYNHVVKEHPSIGKGTVYRNLSILSDEGKIRKVRIPDGADIYDFTLSEHYHIRCAICGKICDMDMDVPADLKKGVRDRHGFEILGYDILFTGICPDCIERKQQEN